MHHTCECFIRYEQEAYLRGYRDGLAKNKPEVDFPKRKAKPSISDGRFLVPLKYATENSNGLNAGEIMELLKISRGTFYTRIKKLIFQGKVRKDQSVRPLRYLTI